MPSNDISCVNTVTHELVGDDTSGMGTFYVSVRGRSRDHDNRYMNIGSLVVATDQQHIHWHVGKRQRLW